MAAKSDDVPSFHRWFVGWAGSSSPPPHGCQIAIDRFLDHMCLALPASELWIRYATLQNLNALHPGAIQGKEGIKFCHLATLLQTLRTCIPVFAFS